jgi:hypothetical protein
MGGPHGLIRHERHARPFGDHDHLQDAGDRLLDVAQPGRLKNTDASLGCRRRAPCLVRVDHVINIGANGGPNLKNALQISIEVLANLDLDSPNPLVARLTRLADRLGHRHEAETVSDLNRVPTSPSEKLIDR